MRRMSLALVIAAWATAEAAAPPSRPTLRLPDAARPTRYAAELTVVPGSATFAGIIDIDLELAGAAPLVWLHGHALTVRQAAFVQRGRTIPARVSVDDSDFLAFAVDETLAAGPARLHVVYEGRIAAGEPIGLFQEKQRGETYAFTQFESIYARRAFPCFDEPGYKVPWQLKVHVKKEHLAVSNTPIASETDEPGDMKLVTFAETAPLPSYLVALAVGRFDRVDAGKAGRNGIPVRIIVPKGRASDAGYAARHMPEVLTRLEDYFDVPFAYAKLDLVAVPAMPGAMENAGMITSDETSVLSLPAQESLDFQRGFVNLMLHETGHQWFGDLVTTAWWDDLWLNESFASWSERRVGGEWHPEWHFDATEIRRRTYTYQNDSLPSARRIREPIVVPGDIQSAFDTITYGKGSAVIGMFEAWLGRDVFRKGVRVYLTEHAHASGTAAGFLAALGAAAERDVAAPFGTFLDQTGVPLVSVALACAPGKAPALALRQERLIPAGTPAAEGKWQIPVCVRFGSGGTSERACTLLTEKTGAMELGGASCPDWVFGNAGGTGYYLVKHEGKLDDALAGAPLTLTERLTVLADATTLAPMGRLGAGAALARLAGLAAEDDPWVLRGGAALAFGLWDRAVLTDELRPRYARFLAKTFGERARALGFRRRPGESEDTTLLRTRMLYVAGLYGEDPALVREASALARRWLMDRGAADPDQVDPVLAIAAQHGDARLFGDAVRTLAKVTEPKTRRRLLAMLAAFRDPALFQRALDMMLDPARDPGEATAMLYGAEYDWKGLPALIRFLDAHWGELLKRFEGDFAAWILEPVGNWCDEPHVAEMERMFRNRAEAVNGGGRVLTQALDTIHRCAAAQARQAPEAAAFLAKY